MAAVLQDSLRLYHLREALLAFPEGDYPDEYAALETMIADYKTAIQAARPFPCYKCAQRGQHLESLDTDDDEDTTLVQCTLVTENNACEGWGYTQTATRVVAGKSGITYEDVE